MLPMPVEDFRDPAIAASLAVLRQVAPNSHTEPSQCGVSYCLRRSHDTNAARARLRFNALGLSLLALVLICISVPFFTTSFVPFKWSNIVGCLLAISGTALLLSGPNRERRMVERHIRATTDDFQLDPLAAPHAVRVEDAHTYHKVKVIADDLGVLRIFPEAQCVQIEGIFCRYLIYAQDVRKLTRIKTFPLEVFNLSYQVANEPLDLTLIFYDSSGRDKPPASASQGRLEQLQSALGTQLQEPPP